MDIWNYVAKRLRDNGSFLEPASSRLFVKNHSPL